KTVSNMQEVAARGGRLILIGERHAAEEAAVAVEHFLAMPDMNANFAPIVYAAPIQMLAYHTAVIMGKDADQPRNLAKSVTVALTYFSDASVSAVSPDCEMTIVRPFRSTGASR